MAKHKWSEDDGIALRQMAREMAEGSIVTQALARFIFQILECVHDEHIEPLRQKLRRPAGGGRTITLSPHDLELMREAMMLMIMRVPKNAKGGARWRELHVTYDNLVDEMARTRGEEWDGHQDPVTSG